VWCVTLSRMVDWKACLAEGGEERDKAGYDGLETGYVVALGFKVTT
jgi:hypothetical protein